ncbi:hypothetical protein [Flavobacterium sp. N1736]|uniref:hypothetical protein n=1 Tax=Flavobacterium sp. N1736 TaxID=2986823 RepID=UPI0022246918|nr:hypothetical protein [Flavobacterium sp. N1736]
MKKIIFITLIVIAVFYLLKQFVYKPYAWKKAINSPEQKLQLGSFIFSRERGSNGSQSMQNYYFVFKVIEINGDLVRLSVIRQLSDKENRLQSDFSTTKKAYQNLKQNIKNVTITGILVEDLYKVDGATYTINDYLISKYPDLKKSRYYYEEIPQNKKNTAVPTDPNDLITYYDLVYSKEEIIKNGRLAPYTMVNRDKGEIDNGLSKDIDLIKN